MELFKLFGTIGIKGVDEANKELSEVADNGEKTGSKLGKAFAGMGKAAVAVGKAVAAGLAVGSVAVAKIGKDAISAYADYEQLVGGVETLFKDSADIVMGYAKNAYKTAGLSANEYMETMTSFSASLIQSLGGDTKKSAEIGNMAITDMSDNANKMGTSMEMIQNAYNGFAKQNYTMLDNLKLGYGGTKEEMERLLKDAQKLSGVKYDMSSFADIAEAIHVVQTEMGITGTTAKEAASTIQGSIGMMKSSWQNLMTGLSDPDQDLGLLVTNFVDSASTALDNIVPRIVELMPRIADALQMIADKVIPMIPKLLDGMLPTLIQGAISLVNGLVSAIPSIIQALMSAIPALIQGIVQIFNALVKQLPKLIQTIVKELPKLVQMIVKELPKMIPELINGIVESVLTILDYLPDIIQPIIDELPNIIIAIVDGILNNLPALINGLVNCVVAIVGQIDQIIQAIIDILPYVIQQVVIALIESLPILLEGIGKMIAAVVKLIWNSIGNAAEMLQTIWKGIVAGIWEIFEPVATWIYDNVIAPIADFFAGLWDSIVSAFHTVIDPWIEIVKRAATWVNDTVVKPVKDRFNEIWKSITSGASKAWEGIKKPFTSVASWFKDVFSKAWKAVKDVFSTGGKIFTGIKEGIEKVFKTVVNGIIGAINKIIKVPFDAISNMLGKIKNIEILGVKPFTWIHTFKTPQIPLLAKGSVLDKPTLNVAGEDGAEAVVPLEKNTGWMNKIAERLNELQGGANSADVQILIGKFDELIEYIKNLKIYLDSGAMVGQLAPAMDGALGDINRLRGRGL